MQCAGIAPVSSDYWQRLLHFQSHTSAITTLQTRTAAAGAAVAAAAGAAVAAAAYLNTCFQRITSQLITPINHWCFKRHRASCHHAACRR
jgi:hypothetical protein